MVVARMIIEIAGMSIECAGMCIASLPYNVRSRILIFVFFGPLDLTRSDGQKYKMVLKIKNQLDVFNMFFNVSWFLPVNMLFERLK